jgi:hypothetical protein
MSHLSNTMAKVLVEWLLIGLMSAVGLGALFRLPMVCEIFDLCRKPNKQVEQPKKENKKPISISLPNDNSKISQPSVIKPPLQTRKPITPVWKPKSPSSPSAETTEPLRPEPLRPEPLW